MTSKSGRHKRNLRWWKAFIGYGEIRFFEV